jgi:hypothetical protein
VFENRVPKKIFELKRDEKTGGWRRLHNGARHNLYFSPQIIRMRWAGRVARMGKKMSAYRVLVGKPEEQRLVGRPRHKSEDNIKHEPEQNRPQARTGSR